MMDDTNLAPAQAGIPRTRTRATILPLVVLVFGLAIVTPPSRADEGGHDPRPLVAPEYKIFLPLVCQNARKAMTSAPPYSAAYPSSYQYHCDGIIGRRAGDVFSGRLNRDITLSAIVYGSFTRPGADEAYVSYDGLEPHAGGFGGGVLFARKGGIWQLAAWIPAERRKDCLWLDNTAPQEMMCLNGDGHADSSYENVYVTLTAQHIDQFMHSSGEDKTTYTLSRPVIAARENYVAECKDMHEDPARIQNERDPCRTRKRDAGFLYGIDSLRRSHRPGVLAEASAAYEAPDDVERACKASCYLDSKTQQGTILFRLSGKTILVMMPKGLNLQSAFAP